MKYSKVSPIFHFLSSAVSTKEQVEFGNVGSFSKSQKNFRNYTVKQ